MKTESVIVSGIEVPQRLRALDRAKVKQIAESMKAIGLRHPITVWEHKESQCELIAGAHRLAAAVELGWEDIDCIFVDGWSDIDRQLWEIDENLMRAELTPAQQADHLKKRRELFAARENGKTLPVSGVGAGTAGPGRGNKGFAAETAEATGLSKRAINLAISRAEGVPEEVRDLIRGTKLDTGVYLDRLKGMAPDAQRARVETDLARINAPQPKKPLVYDVVDADEAQLEALKRAWNKASSEARRQFIEWVNG